MINHHPDDNLLTEYTSGSLPWAVSLSVCAHIQLCPHCRERAANLSKIGGVLLNASVAEPCSASAFEQLMQRIHQAPEKSETPDSHLVSNRVIAKDTALQNIPKVIKKLLPANGKLKWRSVSTSLKMAKLITGQHDYEVALQHVASGGSIVEHDHGGMEITLVLKGSFSDDQGVYSEGDFLVRNSGEIHRPTATLHQDCLCFTVVAAPVRLTGFLGRIVNPFLSFNPA